jgi:hypothetical protein
MGTMMHKMMFGEMIMIDSSNYCKGESRPANMGENSTVPCDQIPNPILV